MFSAKRYRPPHPGETPTPDSVRVRFPVEGQWDPMRPKAGLRCPSPACAMTLVLVESDFGKPPYEHCVTVEHMNCPYCGSRLKLIGYYEVTHLLPAEG
jgi:hypothetical protein